jgi:hypothetical protein
MARNLRLKLRDRPKRRYHPTPPRIPFLPNHLLGQHSASLKCPTRTNARLGSQQPSHNRLASHRPLQQIPTTRWAADMMPRNRLLSRTVSRMVCPADQTCHCLATLHRIASGRCVLMLGKPGTLEQHPRETRVSLGMHGTVGSPESHVRIGRGIRERRAKPEMPLGPLTRLAWTALEICLARIVVYLITLTRGMHEIAVTPGIPPASPTKTALEDPTRPEDPSLAIGIHGNQPEIARPRPRTAAATTAQGREIRHQLHPPRLRQVVPTNLVR